MDQSSQERSALFAGEGSSTLALVIYLAVAILLMIADRRGGYLEGMHAYAARLNGPIYTLAEMPWLAGRTLREGMVQRSQLNEENRLLSQAMLRGELRISELERDLLEQQRLGGAVQLAERERLVGIPARVIDVDLDPYRHRVVVDRGSRHGVSAGAALIDGDGVVGQVIEVRPGNSLVMLLSDPGHGLPVVNARSGLRSVLNGAGQADRLAISSMPLSADLEVGDVLLSSGVGGRFPAGLPVATVTAVERSPGSAFGRASAKPLAGLDRVRELLVVAAPQGLGPWPSTQLGDASALQDAPSADAAEGAVVDGDEESSEPAAESEAAGDDLEADAGSADAGPQR